MATSVLDSLHPTRYTLHRPLVSGKQVGKLLDDPQGLLAALYPFDVGEAVGEPAWERLPGRAGGVRRQDHVRQLEERVIGRGWLLVQHVQTGPQDALLAEGLRQRSF